MERKKRLLETIMISMFDMGFCREGLVITIASHTRPSLKSISVLEVPSVSERSLPFIAIDISFISLKSVFSSVQVWLSEKQGGGEVPSSLKDCSLSVPLNFKHHIS